VLFRDGLPGGDGLLTGLRTLSAAFRRAGSLEAALAPFPRWPRRLTKVTASRRVPVETTPALVEAARRGEVALGSGRVFLRWSGTEPVLRVLVEGRDADLVARVSDEVTAACREALS
jgi:phosphoglucosamine mutase